MSLRPIPYLILPLLLSTGALGCEDKEACTKARLPAADSWKAVMEASSKNKLSLNTDLEEIPAERKDEHVEAWSTIEKQAEMIHSSFLYEKITWKTADPAREKANGAFAGYFAKDKYKGFQINLDDANAKYQAASQACR
jgi:hypothetical protein